MKRIQTWQSIPFPKEVKEKPKKHTCSECINQIEINDRHLNWEGKPILAACKYEKYYILLSQPACEKFTNTIK